MKRRTSIIINFQTISSLCVITLLIFVYTQNLLAQDKGPLNPELPAWMRDSNHEPPPLNPELPPWMRDSDHEPPPLNPELPPWMRDSDHEPPPLNPELPPWMQSSSDQEKKSVSLSWEDYNYANRTGSEISYHWLYEFDGDFTKMSLTLDFNRGWQYMQDVYKTRGHNHGNYYKQFVDNDPFEADQKVLAKYLADLADMYHYDDAKVALSFVQSLPHDPNIGSYQRYAIECLIDRKGDCSDKSALLMAILAYMGHECIALKYPDHLAVGIREKENKSVYYGQRYLYNGFYFYYAETNCKGGVDIGDITEHSTQRATIERGFIRASSINGQTYNTVCEVCGGDGWTHEGSEAGPFYCRKCNGRGRY